jgi:glycerol dehydrogenase
LAETHSFYHGEKVAFGVLVGLQLTDASTDESAAVFSFCEDVGLPTTFTDIGLGNADREKLMDAAEKACAPGESIHHEAGLITPEKVLNAMIAVDAIGRRRKNRTRNHRSGEL